MVRGGIGTSTWDTLHVALSDATPISIGMATIVVALIFTVAVVILNKHWVYFFMAIPIFGVGFLIDLVNDVILVDFEVTSLVLRILTYSLGLALLPLGGSLLIISTFPAGVFDEFNLAVMRALKKESLIGIRVIMEITAVTVALIVSLSAGNGIGTIHIGTLIFAISVGFILKIYLKLFERIGLYENKQND